MKKHTDIFNKIYDTIIFGAGYAGFAAACRCRDECKEVLLVDLTGDLVWESGRAFEKNAELESSSPFRSFLKATENLNGYNAPFLDGAIAEITANEIVRDKGIYCLYYAAPIAADIEEGLINSVTVAVKEGMQKIYAKQWIDASEEGTLTQLCGGPLPAAADSSKVYAHFQAPDFPEPDSSIKLDWQGGNLSWSKSGWDNERVFEIEFPVNKASFQIELFSALECLKNNVGTQLENALFTNASVKPYPIYKNNSPVVTHNLPANLICAVPGLQEKEISTLADRYELGCNSADSLKGMPQSSPEINNGEISLPESFKEESCDIAVAGLGTGGAVAAIAAGREKCSVTAFDLLDFPGGIGVGGGIPIYYWGVPGGLQDEIDDNTLEKMSLCANIQNWNYPNRFHHEAKRAALEEMLAGSGVKVKTRALLFHTEVSNRKITYAWFATPRGPVRVKAANWIDATGDGDLCADAGCSFEKGRHGDGLLHAYTQSGNFFRFKNEKYLTTNLNFDSGYVDPTESSDLTRARITGIHQHSSKPFDEIHRPCCLSPQLGLRQGRHINCDYTITLNDQFERRKFADVVALAACHYDNHAVDYEFESDEALFLVWGCGLRGVHTACHVPYTAILPKDLDNCWLACRAMGVSEEAHASLRMQRDIQRVGEAAGIAAAVASKDSSDSRNIDLKKLQQKLTDSGALLDPEEIDEEKPFGKVAGPGHWIRPFDNDTERINDILSAFEGENFKEAMWFAYKLKNNDFEEKIKNLLKSSNKDLSWRAAAVAAAWKKDEAEVRLLEALKENEEGSLFTEIKDDWMQ
ncbi:MAG: FAD-dependent oxidoreductase, partial [Planctomycetota bacterium]